MSVDSYLALLNIPYHKSRKFPAEKLDSAAHIYKYMLTNMLNKMTDEKLFELCQRYGKISLLYRRKFIGLLPEVYKRELFKKKGFSSIFEFAAKLAGVSEEQVRVILNLEKRFEDKPVLRELLVNGEVSVNKLARIASIATPENQEFFAQQAKLLSKSALDTLVRDEKQNGLPEPKNTSESSKFHFEVHQMT